MVVCFFLPLCFCFSKSVVSLSWSGFHFQNWLQTLGHHTRSSLPMFPLPFQTSPSLLPLCSSAQFHDTKNPKPMTSDVNTCLRNIWDKYCAVKLVNEIKANKLSFNSLPSSFHLLLVSPRHSQDSLFLTSLLPPLFSFSLSFIP